MSEVRCEGGERGVEAPTDKDHLQLYEICYLAMTLFAIYFVEQHFYFPSIHSLLFCHLFLASLFLFIIIIIVIIIQSQRSLIAVPSA